MRESAVPVAELLPSSAERGRWAAALLVLSGAVFGLAAALMLVSWATSAPVELDPLSGEPITPLQAAFVGFACLCLPVGVATATSFLMWLYRAKRRQRWFGAETSPGWAVGVWFVPVVSLLLPYRQIRDLLVAEPVHPADRRPLLGLWWGLILAATALGSAGVVLRGGLTGPGTHPAATRALDFGSYALLALAAFLAARFVSEFERRTARRESAAPPPR